MEIGGRRSEVGPPTPGFGEAGAGAEARMEDGGWRIDEGWAVGGGRWAVGGPPTLRSGEAGAGAEARIEDRGWMMEDGPPTRGFGEASPPAHGSGEASPPARGFGEAGAGAGARMEDGGWRIDEGWEPSVPPNFDLPASIFGFRAAARTRHRKGTAQP